MHHPHFVQHGPHRGHVGTPVHGAPVPGSSAVHRILDEERKRAATPRRRPRLSPEDVMRATTRPETWTRPAPRRESHRARATLILLALLALAWMALRGLGRG